MAELDDMKRALVALRAAKGRIQELERARSEPIAIVGLSCRYPGGVDGPDALWKLLLEERGGIGPIPADRWDVDAWYDADRAKAGRTYVRHGGFLSDIGDFDPSFFGISEREAPSIDPQHRLLLELAAEAFERAGRPLDALRGSATGVFVGICSTDYAQGTMFSGQAEAIDPYTGTGTAISMAAGRLAYTLGLEGPTLAVDTACSSALVATHLACQALRARECDLALAAGVNVMLSPLVTVFFSRLGVLSASGSVRAFDAAADGYVRSEGCGAVVLKRLSDALADRDPILALIRGSATNQNGRGNGLTAPNGRAQEALIRKALGSAGVTPDQVDYVEAFGGGTPIGDRVEVEALDRVFGNGAAGPGRDRPLWIGAVKTNLGHAEGASGMASLAKTVLALGSGTIPATRNLATPNPSIAWARTPVRPVTEAMPWPSGRGEGPGVPPRIAGVSAFGFSGTNAHLVVEAPPIAPPRAPLDGAPVVVALSARSEAALRAHAGRVLAAVDAAPDLRHDDIAYTLSARRGALPVRVAFTATSRDTLRDGLRALADGVTAVFLAPRVEPTWGLVTEVAPLATLKAWGVVPDAIVRPGEPADVDLLVPVSRLGEDDAATLAALLGTLFERGVHVDWEAGYAGSAARAVALPPSVFERRRYWLDAGGARPVAPGVPAGAAAAGAAAAAIIGTADVATAPPPAGDEPAVSAETLRAAPADLRAGLLRGYLRALFAELLRTPPARVDVDRELSEQGVDSIVAVEAIQRILAELGIQVYPPELFDHPTVAALADHLAKAAGPASEEAGATDPAAARDAILAAFPRVPAGPPRPIHAPPTRARGPVFLLSSPRAGSTLLRVMLAGHPALFAPPELHLLLAEDLAAWHARLAPNLLTLGLAQAWVGLGVPADEASARVDDAVRRAEPAWATYAALAERLGDRMLVDKSPSYGFDAAALERAERWFEGARYVHLVRHPYSVVESFARLRMGGLVGAADLDPHVVAEQAWVLSAERIGAFLATIDPARVCFLRYEDLVADPRATAAQLCDFLGIAPHDGMLTPYAAAAPGSAGRMVPPAGGFLGDPNFSRHDRIDPALGERWRDIVLPAPLAPRTAALARGFGYALPDGVTGDKRASIEAEAHLPDDLRAAAAPSTPTTGAPRSILLTGATGFLGAYLLADLLDRTDAVVHLVVRAKTPEAGLARVRDAAIAFGRSTAAHHRVRVYVGDLARPHLGLSDAEWGFLAGNVDTIVHNGAVVHFSLGWRQLRAPNVGGTLEVLRLAATGRAKAVVHVSTKGVYAPSAYPGEGAILEDTPVHVPDAAALGYQQTKWAAERLVLDARARGLATTVVRPGRIGGDAISGRVSPDDFLVRLVRGCVEIGAFPEVSGGLEMVPVDVTSRAIAALVGRPEGVGKAFHLGHADPLDVADAAARARGAGLDVVLLPYAAWRDRLRARVFRGEPSALAPLLGMFPEAPPARIDDRRFDHTNTDTLLGGLDAPPVADQLDRMLRWMRDSDLLPKGAA